MALPTKRLCADALLHNGDMSARNPPALSEGLRGVADALGTRLRVAILESLSQEGPATRAELARRFEVKSTASLKEALDKLEAVGILVVDPPRTEPGRLKRTYTIDPARFADVAVAIAALNPDQDVMSARLRTLLG